jgi:hypothetical protein
MLRDSFEGVEWVGATRLITGRRLRTFGKGRICAALGCTTRLSCYNPTKRCTSHGDAR